MAENNGPSKKSLNLAKCLEPNHFQIANKDRNGHMNINMLIKIVMVLSNKKYLKSRFWIVWRVYRQPM